MPKLSNHTFYLTTEDGLRHSFGSEIHVSTQGNFSCTVPEYLVPALESIAFGKNNAIGVEKLKVNYRAYAPSLDRLKSLVSDAQREYHGAVKTEDFVICYSWFSEVSYWLNPDGTMAANGGMPDAAKRFDDGSGGNWDNHTRRNGDAIHANSTVDHFSVGVYAAIYKRTTYTRASGATVMWKRINQFSDMDKGLWGQKLAGICGLHNPKDPARLKQLPYTEDAAKFFYEAMMAMCAIGRKFKLFFGDDANVIAAIEGRGPSLLSGPTVAAAASLSSDTTQAAK